MYNFLIQIHSIFRWILLFSLLFTILLALYNRLNYKPFGNKLKRLSAITFMMVNIQFIIGLFLYTVSPKVIFSAMAMKVSMTRFFLVEHLTAMLIALILISVGYSGMKRAETDARKYKKVILFYLIGLIIILLAIPWPFYGFGSDWL